MRTILIKLTWTNKETNYIVVRKNNYTGVALWAHYKVYSSFFSLEEMSVMCGSEQIYPAKNIWPSSMTADANTTDFFLGMALLPQNIMHDYICSLYCPRIYMFAKLVWVVVYYVPKRTPRCHHTFLAIHTTHEKAPMWNTRVWTRMQTYAHRVVPRLRRHHRPARPR
jgi:hypothetical protein